jgi:hypothetical protein
VGDWKRSLKQRSSDNNGGTFNNPFGEGDRALMSKKMVAVARGGALKGLGRVTARPKFQNFHFLLVLYTYF